MIIMDGSSILYRSYYGLPDLVNERGEGTGAIVGFMNELLKEKSDNPHDRGGNSQRKAQYEGYKNNRLEMPDDLRRQGHVIKKLVNALGIDIAYAQDGAEGDDAIGSIATHTDEQVKIVTLDADMLQLIDERINVEILRKGKREMYDENRFTEEYGIRPAQLADYKGLRGDTSDNIPGVTGIGNVTARRLIQSYNSIDEIYHNIGLIKPARIRELLKSGKDMAYLSRKLAKIVVDTEIDWSKATLDDSKAKEICDQEGLLSLKARLFGKEEIVTLPEYEIAGKYVYRLKTALKSGEKVEGLKYDLELMAYILDAERGVKKLEGQLEVKGRHIEQIGERLETELQSSGEMELYEKIELPLVKILSEMEDRGVKINLERLQAENKIMSSELVKLETQIYETAGRVFNLNSAQQLGKILFDVMGIPPIKRTRGGYSTDAEVLRQLEGQYPIVSQVQRYRQVFKLKRTYLDGLERQIADDGRVHTTFNQTQTATGRISSSEPNLQNIPIRTPEGRVIRSLFEAGEGYDCLMSADYSQIELRILAHLSGDKRLIEAFQHDDDIHRRTAEEVFGDGNLRTRAKAINYGIVYGISDYGLAKQLDINRKEAADYIDQYFSNYSGVKEYMNLLISEGRRLGYVETMYGRRRQLPGLESKNQNARHLAERQAMNSPIQGSAADIIKLAMLAVDRELKQGNYKSRILLQVHDELVLEMVESEIEAVTELVKRGMEGVAQMKVPLKVDSKCGKTWAEAK